MILLLSTSDTDLLAAQSSGAKYRCANPSRVRVEDLPALLRDVNLVVVRPLGGRATWPEGLASVLGSGVPTVVLGGESSPDAELMATSTVPAGIAQEALSYLVEGGSQNLGQLAAFRRCPTSGGGSNGYRLRLWKRELVELATQTGLTITVCHFPPGTSKWNKIEHRLFSQSR